MKCALPRPVAAALPPPERLDRTQSGASFDHDTARTRGTFTRDNAMNYAERQVADIAANLPGATKVFRDHKIDFCCGGHVPLAEAAAARGASLADIESRLAELEGGETEAPQSSEELIDHIIERYHETHRAE